MHRNVHNKNVLTWNEAGTCVDKLAKKLKKTWKLKQAVKAESLLCVCVKWWTVEDNLNPLLQPLKSQFKSTISRCPGGKPLNNPLVHTLFFPFQLPSVSVCQCLSVCPYSVTLPLCPPPLSCLLKKGPFTKKRHNMLFCLLCSWNDAISTSSCCHSCFFVYVWVVNSLHANFQNFFKSLFHFVSGKSHFKNQYKNYIY